jgi:hypothetical protein
MKKKPKTEVFTTSWGSKVTITYDENLKKVDPKESEFLTRKLKEANENLSRIKNLKDLYK